jgi:hypothetical protein
VGERKKNGTILHLFTYYVPPCEKQNTADKHENRCCGCSFPFPVSLAGCLEETVKRAKKKKKKDKRQRDTERIIRVYACVCVCVIKKRKGRRKKGKRKEYKQVANLFSMLIFILTSHHITSSLRLSDPHHPSPTDGHVSLYLKLAYLLFTLSVCSHHHHHLFRSPLNLL